jgi:hypothetical protein
MPVKSLDDGTRDDRHNLDHERVCLLSPNVMPQRRSANVFKGAKALFNPRVL